MAAISVTLLSNPQFINALGKLVNAEIKNFGDVRKIHKLKVSLSEEAAIFESERKKILEKYCVKDEEGKPVLTDIPGGQQNYSFSEENFPMFNEEFTALTQNTFELEPVRLQTEPSNISISAEEFALLSLVIDFPEAK